MAHAIGKLFLDSGAHSLYNEKVRKRGGDQANLVTHKITAGTATRDELEGLFTYYGSDDRLSKRFRRYMDRYAAFVKEHQLGIDEYVSVDVIFNPHRSYLAHRYLVEEHGLHPVPVVHYGEDEKWIVKYLEDGHNYIGIGGLGQGITTSGYMKWADKVFTLLCPASNGNKPVVRTHGFALTSFRLLKRYPWYSVDSTTYAKMAGYGWLLVPHSVKEGEFDFTRNYWQIGASPIVSPAMAAGKHMDQDEPSMGRVGWIGQHKRLVQRWLDYIGLPMGKGKMNPETKEVVAIEEGVVTSHGMRQQANLRYFDMLAKSRPEYPATFRKRSPLFPQRVPNTKSTEGHGDTLQLYFSGMGNSVNRPEAVLHRPAVMMTYYEFYKRKDRLDTRFSKHLKRRKKRADRKS